MLVGSHSQGRKYQCLLDRIVWDSQARKHLLFILEDSQDSQIECLWEFIIIVETFILNVNLDESSWSFFLNLSSNRT